MPFGYSRDIFRYPPVQYIPLDPFQERIGSYTHHFDRTRLYIYPPSERDALHKVVQRLNLKENYSLGKGEIAVLVFNGKVQLVQYRGYEVILVAKKNPGYYHLFKVTDRYFYKDRLIFVLYNGENSEKLDWKRYEIPK